MCSLLGEEKAQTRIPLFHEFRVIKGAPTTLSFFFQYISQTCIKKASRKRAPIKYKTNCLFCFLITFTIGLLDIRMCPLGEPLINYYSVFISEGKQSVVDREPPSHQRQSSSIPPHPSSPTRLTCAKPNLYGDVWINRSMILFILLYSVAGGGSFLVRFFQIHNPSC